jgi:L-rhamnose mutarotase
MSAVDTKFYEKKKSSTFYLAVWFLFLVLVITGGIFFYNSKLEELNWDFSKQIQQLNNSISIVEQDSNIQTYSIYEKNEKFLIKLWEQSNIPSFVSHLKKQFAIHGIDAKWFNYSQWTVTIDLSAQTNDNGYAYQKVVKFLRDYNELEDGLFLSDFVPNFDGYDRINFTGKFTLK